MAPNTKLWPIGPHTHGKHMVLRGYLDAWLPIMGMHPGKIIFVDGFAGPGEYAGGEEGSPVIAIKALNEHPAKARIVADIVYFFVEGHTGRAAHLEEIVRGLRAALPANAQVHVVLGKFDETMTGVLDSIEGRGKALAPCFVMVDPFGVSDTPMSVLARILKNPKSELYISFMYEAINRFRDAPEFEPHLDALFGTPRWRDGIDMPESDARREFFYGLYTQQLKAAGAKHVVWFELKDGNRHVYTIFFATQHHVGCNRMKQAIWKIAPLGEYEFRGSRSSQMSLTQWFTASTEPLRRELRAQFGGAGRVAVETVNEWISGDGTTFHTSHLKSTLRDMENAGDLVATASGLKPRRKGSFADGTIIEFAVLR